MDFAETEKRWERNALFALARGHGEETVKKRIDALFDLAGKIALRGASVVQSGDPILNVRMGREYAEPNARHLRESKEIKDEHVRRALERYGMTAEHRAAAFRGVDSALATFRERSLAAILPDPVGRAVLS